MSKQMHDPLPSKEAFLAGSVAGAAGMTLGHPLDTMKTYAQTGHGSPPSVRALFRGIGPPIATAGCLSSIILGVYENVRRQLWPIDSATTGSPGPPPLWAEGVAGSCSGLCISVLTGPMGRIKVQQQLTGAGFMRVLRDAVSTRTLYAGYSMTALFEASRGVYMMSYALLKRSLGSAIDTAPPALPLWARTIAGAGANIISWSLLYPVDVVRSVQMAQAAAKPASVPGPINCARALVAEGGLTRLYRGFGATMLRAGPVAGIILPCFELVLPWLEARRRD